LLGGWLRRVALFDNTKLGSPRPQGFVQKAEVALLSGPLQEALAAGYFELRPRLMPRKTFDTPLFFEEAPGVKRRIGLNNLP